MDAPPIQYARTDDGVNVAYSVLGTGPALVLLPDIPIALDKQWAIPEIRAWQEAFAAASTVVTFDPPGVGLSDRDAPDISFQTGGRALEAVVEALQLPRFDLFGAYRRTPYALAYAAHEPAKVDHLILWSPYGEGAAVQQTRGHDVVAKLLQTDWRSFTEVVLRVSTGLPSERVDAIAAMARESISREVYVGQAREQRKVDVRELAGRVAAPTLVLHRPDSTMVSVDFVRDIAARVPGATLRMVPGSAVYPYFDDAAAVLDAVADFLGRGGGRPAGTGFRTILFTDLAASTATTQRLGDAAAQALVRAHNEIVRAALENHHGHEIKHTGDGIMAWFPAASNALDCAQAIQEAVAGLANPDLGVKIGLNAGEPIAEEDDLYGTAVQIAARVTDQAQAGEVVCTNVVRELVAGKEYLFSERAPAALKGVEEPARLFTLGLVRP